MNKKLDSKLEELVKDVNLTAKELVELIASGYHIETLRFVPNPFHPDEEFAGIHIIGGAYKEILINADLTNPEAKYAVIHEFYHAQIHKLELPVTLPEEEKLVEFLTDKKYSELFGKKYEFSNKKKR